MRCSCCNKKKFIFDSFEKIEFKNYCLNLCPDCSALMYNLRDAINEKDKNEIKTIMNKIDSKYKGKCDEFVEWKDYFIQSCK